MVCYRKTSQDVWLRSAPNNSFKPKPLRGSVQVLDRIGELLVKHKLLSLAFLFIACIALQTASAREVASSEEIHAALNKWNETANRADLEGFMELFDDSDSVILVGSDRNEIYRGKTEIRAWLAQLFKHNRFSWDLSHADIDPNGNTAWAFVDGTMTVTEDTGAVKKTPYRFSGVLIKRGHDWKWRLFNGSIPAGE